MSEIESVAALMESTNSKIQQLQWAFAELQSQSAGTMNLKCKQLEDHFHRLEQSLKKKFDELKQQEMEFEETVAKSEAMLEQREAAVMVKELTSLERLQEKRDAALAMIFGKSKLSLPVLAINPMDKALSNLGVKLPKPASEVNAHLQVDYSTIKPHSQLVILCEEMNVKGLHKFISDNRKNMTAIREEIPGALKRTSHPYGLVLDSLEDFYAGDNLVLDGKKDGDLLGIRRTCLMLMVSLGQMHIDAITGFTSEGHMLTTNAKERAKKIAVEWKSKLESLDIDASNGNCLESHAFLQLLATFGISAEYSDDDLCRLLPSVSRRRQTPELCRLLGLSQKMPDVIGVLVDSGRPIDAINLAYAFGLTEQFEPVQLLKAYLRDVKKVSHATKNVKMSPGAQNEMNERELSALKTVIKCIEEHKLEEQYPVDPLQKRVLQLENAKADKRRAVEAAKPQSKRPRANGSVFAPRVTSSADKIFYPATPERHPYPYERQFVYGAEAHHPPIMSSTTYTIQPAHAPYYGNGYPVQYRVPYIH